MNPKIKKLRNFFLRNQIDAFLVTKSHNISYLLNGFFDDAWLLVTHKNIFYITDSRYVEQVKRQLKRVQICQIKKSLEQSVADIAFRHKLKRIGFNAKHIDVFRFKQLSFVLKKYQLIDSGSMVEEIRSIKTKEEILCMQEAISIHFKCYSYLKKIIKPGLTEKQILDKLRYYVLDQEAQLSFKPIIASGPHSSFPHATVTERKLRREEVLLVDFGIDFKGYKSDLTRMFFLGKIPHQIKEIYNFVEQAQHLAIKNIKPGQKIRFIDQQARNFLRQNKLGKFFVHSLGHGIGLEVHEDPVISSSTSCTLKEGMIFTVEPGVYLPGRFGIRIEDMVLVTAKGCEVLSL